MFFKMDRNHLLYNLYRLYQFLVFYPVLVFSTVVFGTLSIFLSIFVSSKIGALMGVVWARINSLATPMTVRVRGRENAGSGNSYVIVANHQSQYDILVLYGWLLMDFKWVMKAELRKIPVLGYTCYKMGHIFVNRAKRSEAVKSISSVNGRIKNGTSIIFFPEGKRSSDGRLLDFKKGAFIFALENNLPILPVSIINTEKILPKGSTELLPGRAELVFHEPISTEGYSNENLDQLISRSRESIGSVLDHKELEN